MDISTVFTSFIACDYLELDVGNLKRFSYVEKEKSQGREVSNYGGWQSNDYSIDHPELSQVGSKIKQKISNLLPKIGFNNNFTITNCWININEKDHFNIPHTHGFSTLAGVFYISAPTNGGRLILRNPVTAHDFCINKKTVATWNEFNSSTWEIEPEVNKLVIWPSWIDHYTLPNMSNEHRISLAFNVSVNE
jgi:uncharacterized protein (TIGR02466 family)